MLYTIAEKVTMIKWYYSGNSFRATADMFAVNYPDRPVPSKSTVRSVIQRFEKEGTAIHNCKCSRPIAVAEEQENNTDLEILLHVEENSGLSTRCLGEVVDKHHTTVWRKLKKYKYHPYKYQKHQELREGDEFRRAEFCFNVMERANNDRSFLRNICFTDECTFSLNNEPNSQNLRYWSKTNQHRFVETRTQYPQKINLWAGILGHHIIGPFFLEGNLTGEYFLELLQNHIGPALAEVAPENEETWFQMDGCPAHNTLAVREYLQNAFVGHVIGPHHTIGWPARSPDLSINDFFLWGHLKSRIYKETRHQDLEQLKNIISAACAQISPQQLSNSRKEFYDRLGYCLAVNGGLFEHLIQ